MLGGFYDNDTDTVYEEFELFKLAFIKDNNKKLYDKYQKIKEKLMKMKILKMI